MKAMQIMLQNSAQSIFAFFYKKNKKADPRSLFIRHALFVLMYNSLTWKKHAPSNTIVAHNSGRGSYCRDCTVYSNNTIVWSLIMLYIYLLVEP